MAELRTESTRVYLRADGRLEAEVSARPEHYRDAHGKWQAIDTTVRADERDGFRFGNDRNVFRSSFGDRSDQLVRLTHGGRHIELGIETEAKTQAKALVPVVVGNTVLYRNAFAGADLEYQVGDALKENIVLRSVPHEAVYRFTMRLGGVTAKAAADGSIRFYPGRDTDGVPVFTMPKPFMYDSQDDGGSPYGKAWSDAVTQTVEQRGANITITVRADQKWLAAAERRYPVVIDPTITIQPTVSQSQDVMIAQDLPTTNFDGNWRLSTGTTNAATTTAYRSLVRFGLGVVPAGTTLSSARLRMYYDQGFDPSGRAVEIETRRITSAWDETTATWNSANAAFAEAGTGTQTKPATVTSAWHEFDIRNLAQAWVSGTSPNHGVMLKAKTEAPQLGGVRYEAAEFAYNGENANTPTLVLTYGRPGVQLAAPTKIHSTGAELSWTPYAGADLVEYQVHRAVFQTFTPSAATLVAPVRPGVTRFTDTTAVPTPVESDDPFGQVYYYMVAVKTSDGSVIPAPTRIARLPRAGRIVQLLQGDALDTTLSSGEPATGHDVLAGSPWLSVGNNSATYGKTRTTVKFADLSAIPSGARVLDASFQLWSVTTIPAADATYQARALTRSFDEATASWNNATASTPWTTAGGDAEATVADTVGGVTNDPAWREFAVDGIVQRWVNNPASNHGLLVRQADETSPAERTLFLSSEAPEPELRPKLVVTYTERTPVQTYFAPSTPSIRMIPGDDYTIPVTVSNPTDVTWRASDWVLSYHWTLPDGTDVTTGGNRLETSLPADVPPGGGVDVNASVRTPIRSDEGNKRHEYVLRWELRNTSTGQWLSTSDGIGPLDQRVTVEDPTSDQLGLEKFYAYSGKQTGAGSSLMTNLYSGNAVWSYDAFTNPSRGLSTFLRLAYNSEDTSDSVAGFGWSVQASSVARLGTPLRFHPKPHPTTVVLTDGDGTSHTFTWDDAADTWRNPKGVHLFLQQLADCGPNTEEPRAWVMTRPDRTRFFWDCAGYLSSVEDNNGNVMSFTYEERRSNNQPTKFLRYVTDATGRQTLTLNYFAKGESYDFIDDVSWTRRTANNLTNPHIIDHVKSITDISGRTLTFTYTDKGLLGELVDGAGAAGVTPKVFSFQYDMTQGNKNVKLVRITDPRRNASVLGYYSRPEDDPKFKWSSKSVTDRLGHTAQYAYADPDGQAGSEIRTVVTDAENHGATYLIDGFGRPTKVTNAKNETTSLTWDADNNVTRFEEPNGAATVSAFDQKTGYPIEIRDPEAVANGWPGTRLTYRTGLDGHTADLIGKRSPEDRAWAFTYTDEGDLATVTDPLGTATPDPDDFTTRYTYDTWGQLETATDANGHTTRNSRFDANGYPQTIADPLEKRTDFVYDVRGQVTKVTDALGKHTTQTYDAFGRPLVLTEPKKQDAGLFIVTPAPVYDANDNVTASTAPNGAVSTSAFDAADRVLHTIAPPDRTGGPERKTSFTYDRVGNLLTITEPNGNLTPAAGDFVTTHVYDEVYQLIEVLDADANKTSYEYDNTGNQVTVIDARKNATADPADFSTKYTYDRTHRLTRSTDALGKFTTTVYDRDGLVTATVDQRGTRTEHTLNGRGEVVETTVPHRDDNGSVTNRITRFEYDQVGNQTRVISPRGVATTTDPDDFAQVTVYDELNRVKETRTEFDRDDARYRTADRTSYTYDAVGRMVTVSAPPSSGESVRNDTTYTYFDNGWTETATDPWDIRTRYDYDALGGQTSRIVAGAGDSSSRTMTWQYFPDGKLRSRADDGVPVGRHVVLVDNSDFNNTSATGTWATDTTATGRHAHNYRTDEAGTGSEKFDWRLNIPQNGLYEVFVNYPAVSGAATDSRFTIVHSGGSTTRSVDQTTGAGTWVSLGKFAFTEGNTAQVSVSDQAGGTVVADAVKLVRDNAGETDTERYDYTYEYDPNGNQTTITDNSSTAVVDSYSVSYTGLNQVDVIREFGDGTLKNTTSFDYNENGAPITATHDSQHASFTYDQRNLLDSVTNGASAADPDAKTTSYTYTDRGEPLRQVKGNRNTVDYSYHLDGLPRSMVERKADQTLVAEHTFGYDLNGNRTRDVARTMNADNHGSYLDTTYQYAYDPRNRISSLTKTGAGAGTETYVHDANNNVIEQRVGEVTTTYNYDRNRLLTASAGGATSSFNYDPFGRLDTVTAGDTVAERNIYDGFDHVVEHRRTGAGTTRFTYDPWDRTTSRTTDAGTGSAKTTTYAYLGLAAEVLTESVDGEVETSYEYAPWGERLSQIKHGPDGDERTYYGYNAHSDVEQMTGESGDTVSTYGYTAYGGDDTARFTGEDKPDPQNPAKEPSNPYRFNAKRWDQATASYDMGFRDYSPGLNRFLTRDSYNGALADLHLGLDPFTGSRYAFGGGNPISMVELDGHCSINPLSWGDCASDAADAVGDAAGWVGDQADAAWDAAWEVGSDIVSGVGDFLGDVGEWVSHNADALADIAVDALEIIGGAAAVVGGAALIVTGITACAASTPLVLTGVGAIATGGICWGGAATVAGGIALAGLGVAMVADGGSRLPDNISRLESTGGSSGSAPDPPRLDSTGKVHGDIPSHVPDNWTREQLEELEEDLQTSIRTRQAEQLRLGEDGPHRARINEELRLLRQVQKKLSGS